MINFVKWGILLKVLPWVSLFALAKAATHWLGWEIWTFNALTGSLLSAATFTIALVLSGTLADYRASEGMPLQIANALETIADTNQALAYAYPEYPAAPLQQGLVAVSEAVLAWLEAQGEFVEIAQELDRLNPLFAKILTIHGTPVLVNRMQTEQAKIRAVAWQMQVNRDTDFLQSAYVLLWIFLSSSTAVLLMIGTENFSENILISSFIFISFFYLLFLIRDLDNPFEYDGKSSVDVDLTVLRQTQERLRALENI
jgi:hypothetical protein